MNIFDQAPEFIDLDNRKNRGQHPLTGESLTNRFDVQLPKWLIENDTVLDLGSCLGAAGHYALTNGATHYTGVEIQQSYATNSAMALGKYWPTEKFDIVQQGIEEFLDQTIASGTQYDHVLVCGVLYAFINIISILEKVAAVSRKSIIIETLWVPPNPQKYGIISIRPNMHINYAEEDKAFSGTGSTCNINALDLILQSQYFYRTEDRLIPKIIEKTMDPYSDTVIDFSGAVQPVTRYIVRYYRTQAKSRTILDSIKQQDREVLEEFRTSMPVVNSGVNKAWKFDEQVAARFQTEAEQHIPDYHRVIDMCVDVAKRLLKPDAPIVDFGSALGYTVDKFINAGFTNVTGVDNSESMISQSLHKECTVLSDRLPTTIYKLIVVNWTLHFILDKIDYLTDFYNKLDAGGMLILSEKTVQSLTVKNMYYDFKRANGVTDEYITTKEKSLNKIMQSMPVEWYVEQLANVGFVRIEIINAHNGFVTFLCKKL
jgi:cyclopropane fatty-acyl-phospholipid synthase-like methyltransferase